MDLVLKEQEQYRARFYWGNDEENMWIDLVFLTDEEKREIRKECTRHHVDFPKDPETKQMVRVESDILDTEKMIDTLLDRTLEKWGNYKVNGKELECNFANKKLLIEKAENKDGQKFAQFYAESLVHLTKDAKETFGSKEATKNS